MAPTRKRFMGDLKEDIMLRTSNRLVEDGHDVDNKVVLEPDEVVQSNFCE